MAESSPRSLFLYPVLAFFITSIAHARIETLTQGTLDLMPKAVFGIALEVEQGEIKDIYITRNEKSQAPEMEARTYDLSKSEINLIPEAYAKALVLKKAPGFSLRHGGKLQLLYSKNITQTAVSRDSSGWGIVNLELSRKKSSPQFELRHRGRPIKSVDVKTSQAGGVPYGIESVTINTF